MKINDLDKVYELKERLDTINLQIERLDISHTYMNVSVNFNGVSVGNRNINIPDCPPATSRAISDLLLAQLQKDREKVTMKLKALGVEL